MHNGTNGTVDQAQIGNIVSAIQILKQRRFYDGVDCIPGQFKCLLLPRAIESRLDCTSVQLSSFQKPSMGKRKKSSRQPQQPKKREPLPTTFPCLFCNHENSIVVKLDKKLGLGNLSCKVCGQRFQTGINYLSAAVDVYSDWVDACDAVAKDTVNKYEEHGVHGIRAQDHHVSPEQPDSLTRVDEDRYANLDQY
ncbi:hypothetical protein MAP00_006953 [Monascus purpureus]|nr:hypothetical protein MAP00_006953 [Monascus purpureus]